MSLRAGKEARAHAPDDRMRRDTGALSTTATQADLTLSWKQEVNQRIAAHNSRKSSLATETNSQMETHQGATSRAAEAAARVAARYAKAPSYSQMLASEARAAVRAAEAASWAALEAQAAAESLLAGLEAAAVAERPRELEVVRGGAPERAVEHAREATAEPALPAEPKSSSAAARPSFGILWDADMPVRQPEPAAVRATHGPDVIESSADEWWPSSRQPLGGAGSEDLEVVEPAQPIHANLIEFPRELVATRRIRPRRAEGTNAGIGNAVGQLSIFEVDPGSISIEPAAAEIVTETAPEWPWPDWSSIQLDEDPYRTQPLNEQSLDERLDEEAKAAPVAAVFELAPVGRRLMAVVVDGALIAGVFLAAAVEAMDKAKALPTTKEIELGSAVTLTLLFLLYHAFFFTLASATPGMKWARVALSTFAGERPTRRQRLGRLWALGLSLLPVGLGAAWAIFDEEHLTWHDRLSGTYTRKV
jgi:uncharacterized RDD family membrane protein YckC